MISKPLFAFLFITILISTFAIVIISHELTHYVLGETATGICFGNCEIRTHEYNLGGVAYNITVNSLGFNENLASINGLIVGGLFFIGWIYILIRK